MDRLMKVAIICLLYLIPMVLGDLPVHCLRSEIIGEWEFHLGKTHFKADLDKKDFLCGHTQPNSPGDYHMNVNPKFPGGEEIVKVSLQAANVASLTDSKGTKLEGSWTLVYDQSMMVDFKSYSFLTNFKYDLKEHNNDKFSPRSSKSLCFETVPGWVKYLEEEDNTWGCFYGDREGEEEKKAIKQEQAKENDTEHHLLRAALRENDKNFKSILMTDLKVLVDRINNDSKSRWKARMPPKEYNVKTLLELMKKMGVRMHSPIHDQKKKTYSHPYTHIRSSIQGESTAEIRRESWKKSLKENIIKQNTSEKLYKYWHTAVEDIPDDVIPKEWDWRDVDGVNYVSEVRKQAGCGSCYTIGAIETSETRFNIAFKNRQRFRFSAQYPLSCSPFSEGCDGGFPIQPLKFSHDFGFIPEKCFPYASGNAMKCSARCDNKQKKRYFVGDYSYVDQYYGNMNEMDIKKEIFARGPVTAANMMPSQSILYASGIYECSKDYKDTINDKDFGQDLEVKLSKLRDNWMPIDHAFSIVGYGQDKAGIKYWIIQNSWGEFFGEKGFFKLKRGSNECGIETLVAVMLPQMEDN